MVSPSSITRHVMRAASAAAVAAVLLAAPPHATSAPITDLQTQASKLETQVSSLERRYDELQERSRGARIELQELRADLAVARVQLAAARGRQDEAHVQLRDRAVSIYVHGTAEPVIRLAYAGSITKLFAQIDAYQQISSEDSELLDRMEGLARRVERHERTAGRARDQQVVVLKRLRRDEKDMALLLAKRRTALASVQADVRNLMEAQRRAAAAAIAAQSRIRAAAITQGSDPEQAVRERGDAAGAGGAGADPTMGGIAAGPTVASSAPSDTDGDPADAGSDAASVSEPEPESESLPAPRPPASGVGAAAASIATGKVGSPYVWAAAGPDTFDCSGLVVWAFAQAGRPGLPHSTYSLISMGVEVPLDQAQPGDLVFTNSAGHMGIYLGGGSMVHSPRTGRTVSIEPLTYYTVVSVRRI